MKGRGKTFLFLASTGMELSYPLCLRQFSYACHFQSHVPIPRGGRFLCSCCGPNPFYSGERMAGHIRSWDTGPWLYSRPLGNGQGIQCLVGLFLKSNLVYKKLRRTRQVSSAGSSFFFSYFGPSGFGAEALASLKGQQIIRRYAPVLTGAFLPSFFSS